MTSSQDLTLKMFLVQELSCTILPAADHAQLAAMDTGDGKTLADHVSQGNFEHIRLELKNDISIDIVSELVCQYYKALGYDVTMKDTGAGFAIVAEQDNEKLVVSGLFEELNILNISVV